MILMSKRSNYYRILSATWIIYALFYFCRVNFSIVLPLMNMDLNLTYSTLGIIASSFFITYAIGQIANGYMSVHYNPVKLLIIGVFGSSIMNILFGLSNDFITLLLLWSINGYFQSIGWPTTIRLISSAIRLSDIGKVFGLFNTSWALGHVLSWFFTSIIVSFMGWRNGFIINGFIFSAIGFTTVTCLLRKELKNFQIANNNDYKSITKFRFYLLIIAFLSLSYFIIDFVRYGLIVYLPSYIYSLEQVLLVSTLISIILPVMGSIGMIITGWLSDKLFRNNEVLLAILLSLIVTISIYIFPQIYESYRFVGLMILILLSLSLYGLASQIISIIPAGVISRKYLSMVSGIVNSLGSFGAFTSSIISGIMIEAYGFHSIFKLWSYVHIIQIVSLMIIYIKLKEI